MIKDIRFTGYAAQPSDYEAPDGALSVSLNLVPDNGHLEPAQSISNLPNLCTLDGRRLYCIHDVKQTQHFITGKEQPDGNVTLFWSKKDSAGKIQMSDADAIGTVDEVRDIAALGNTLVVATNSGLVYLLWKEDRYVMLGARPPVASLVFAAVRGEAIRKTANVNTGDSNAKITESIYAAINSAAAEIQTDGKFHQPFFVRYAYRLVDGSYAWHSSPVLMQTDVLPPTALKSDNKYYISIFPFTLHLSQLEVDVEQLLKWSDVIAGIDIFVSAPIYTYDQSKEISKPSEPVYEWLQRVTGVNSNTKVFAGMYGRWCENKQGIISETQYETINNGENTVVAGIDLHEGYHNKIKNNALFYHVASIPVEDLTNDAKRASLLSRPLPLAVTDLRSLLSRPTLPDDYQSHCTITAKYLYPFNARLNAAGITLSKPEPLPLNVLTQCSRTESNPPVDPDAKPGDEVDSRKVPTDPYSKPQCDISVWIKNDGVVTKVTHAADTHGVNAYYNDDSFPRYIYYPDQQAFKLELKTTDGKTYAVDLKPHPNLNGAYYYREDYAVNPLPAETSEGPRGSFGSTIELPSKLYTTAANNPFVFPLTGINTIGTGEIYGIRTAARALSQGQFGMYPLYAFTSEGVWALTTTESGGYSAKQPITRDVCINPESITQTDTAVVFAADRGLMMLEGSQTSVISDVLLNLDPVAPSVEALVGEEAVAPVVPFRAYLKDCRVTYDYTNQRLIVHSPSHEYAYVYSIRSGAWGMMSGSVLYGVPSYPEALAVNGVGHLVNFSGIVSPDVKMDVMLETRPLKLDAPDVYKTVTAMVARGNFAPTSIDGLYLFGSRDLINWTLVGWNKKSYMLRRLHGSPYKYFKIVIRATLAHSESLSGITVEYTPKYTNKMR